MPDTVVSNKILKKPEEKHWIRYIKQRIEKNKNFLGFISGPTGSGKSWSNLSICESLDKEFNINRVVFSALELMNLVNSGKLKRGSAICFEEAGVVANNKNWASVTNKMLNYLVQTFRHRGFVLIMNSPYMDFVDSATRKLFHSELETVGIDFKTNECKLKPQIMQWNSRKQKMYYKWLRVITNEGRVPIKRWRVPKPSQELINQYEEKKTEFTNRLNKQIYDELLREQEEKNKSKAKKTELTEVQEETLEMLKQGQTLEQIAKARGRATSVVRKTMELLRKKGYKFKSVYNGLNISYYQVEEPDKE